MTDLRVLDDAHQALADGVDPDGPAARGALILAAHTAVAAAAADTADTDRWTFAGIALQEGNQRLTEDLTDDVVLAAEPVQLDAAGAAAARTPLHALVTSLAGLYAGAAANTSAPPWRRLVWADVADDLDRAAAELT